MYLFINLDILEWTGGKEEKQKADTGPWNLKIKSLNQSEIIDLHRGLRNQHI